MRRALGLGIAILIALPSLGVAQSMAELAAREREKRKGQKTGKVITDEDLRRGQAGRGNVNTGLSGPAAASPAPGQPAAPGAAGAEGEKPKTEEELRAEQEQAWRARLKKAQEDVQRLTLAADTVQKHLGDIAGNLYGSQRTALLAEHEKLKAELLAAQQQVAALEDEGRRSRFRP